MQFFALSFLLVLIAAQGSSSPINKKAIQNVASQAKQVEEIVAKEIEGFRGTFTKYVQAAIDEAKGAAESRSEARDEVDTDPATLDSATKLFEFAKKAIVKYVSAEYAKYVGYLNTAKKVGAKAKVLGEKVLDDREIDVEAIKKSLADYAKIIEAKAAEALEKAKALEAQAAAAAAEGLAKAKAALAPAEGATESREIDFEAIKASLAEKAAIAKAKAAEALEKAKDLEAQAEAAAVEGLAKAKAALAQAEGAAESREIDFEAIKASLAEKAKIAEAKAAEAWEEAKEEAKALEAKAEALEAKAEAAVAEAVEKAKAALENAEGLPGSDSAAA